MSDTPDDKEPPTVKPNGWKKACAAVLALTVSHSVNELFSKIYIHIYNYVHNKYM